MGTLLVYLYEESCIQFSKVKISDGMLLSSLDNGWEEGINEFSKTEDI